MGPGGSPIWDWPTRAFHWLLACAVLGAYVTGEWFGGMENHMRFGQVVFALIVFRIVWGFIGGRRARFTDFLYGPKTVFAYARSLVTGAGWKPHAGHNPLGGWAVVGLLTLCLVQSGAGLFTSDDILWDGPLVSVVPSAVSAAAGAVHHQAINLLLAMVALHVGAIAFYAKVRKTNLVRPMITGKSAAVDPREAAAADARVSPVRLAAAVAAAAGSVIAINLIGG